MTHAQQDLVIVKFILTFGTNEFVVKYRQLSAQ